MRRFAFALVPPSLAFQTIRLPTSSPRATLTRAFWPSRDLETYSVLLQVVRWLYYVRCTIADVQINIE